MFTCAFLILLIHRSPGSSELFVKHAMRLRFPPFSASLRTEINRCLRAVSCVKVPNRIATRGAAPGMSLEAAPWWDDYSYPFQSPPGIKGLFLGVASVAHTAYSDLRLQTTLKLSQPSRWATQEQKYFKVRNASLVQQVSSPASVTLGEYPELRLFKWE